MSNFTIYCSLKELLVPCFAAADQGIGFNDSIFFYQRVFVARFTPSGPSTPVRNATNLRTFCFRLSLCLSRVFCDNQRVLRSLIYIEPNQEPMSQPSSSVTNATSLWIFCFREYISLCLSKDSLSCETRSLDR